LRFAGCAVFSLFILFEIFENTSSLIAISPEATANAFFKALNSVYTPVMATITRRATPDDIPVLVDLMEEFYAEADYPLDRQWATNSFSTLLRDESFGAVWIIFHDGAPAGHIVLTIRFSMEYGGFDAFIDDLFIRSNYRRQGLGRAALKALFDECARRRVLAVHVEVGQDNLAANALYHSYGLEPGSDGRQMLTVRLNQ
jgi:ribosomal protein S18 acetylase RimI-like enzyme